MNIIISIKVENELRILLGVCYGLCLMDSVLGCIVIYIFIY